MPQESTRIGAAERRFLTTAATIMLSAVSVPLGVWHLTQQWRTRDRVIIGIVLAVFVIVCEIVLYSRLLYTIAPKPKRQEVRRVVKSTRYYMNTNGELCSETDLSKKDR